MRELSGHLMPRGLADEESFARRVIAACRIAQSSHGGVRRSIMELRGPCGRHTIWHSARDTVGRQAMASQTPTCDFGWHAVNFELPDPDGRRFSLTGVRGPSGTLVMFICNHCPFVRAIADRLAADAKALQQRGIGVIAIMPNDYRRHPDDAPAKMKEFARRHAFTFPYVIDETQAVARAYHAVCTPDFFGFNSVLELQYRGRLDPSGMQAETGGRRELLEAMIAIAETGQGPRQQFASIGCSVKWRDDA